MDPWKEHGNATGGFYKCNKFTAKKKKKHGGDGDAAATDATATATAAAAAGNGNGVVSASREAAAAAEKEKQAEAEKEAKELELNRYLHYYQRYCNHDQVRKGVFPFVCFVVSFVSCCVKYIHLTSPFTSPRAHLHVRAPFNLSQARRFATQQLLTTEARMQQLHNNEGDNVNGGGGGGGGSGGGGVGVGGGGGGGGCGGGGDKASDWMDVQFLREATECVIASRQVLKYTYVLAYYLADTASKALFEFLQQELERNTEHLSQLSEQPLADVNRIEVVNATRVARTFRENLLEGVRGGLRS
jgi:hypothetical protein